MATYFGTNANNYLDYLGTESLVAYGYGGNDTLISNINNDSLFGGSGNDYLDGFSGDDYLSGGRGRDTLIGGAGNDTLDGGLGNDLMLGGIGDDAYVVNSIFDVAAENAGEGIDTVFSTANYTLGDNLESLVLFGDAIAGAGNDLDNLIIGNDANNILYGLAGNDVLDGGLGIDTLLGGTGDDFYSVDTTTDIIIENAGEGFDLVASTVNYTLGNNLESLLLGETAANGTGNSLNNFLIGNAGNNILSGEAGNDILLGGSGNDLLVGDDGNDRLDGYGTTGTEFDALAGGAGFDLFVLGGSLGVSYLGDGYATITDWNPSNDFIEARGDSSQYYLLSGNYGVGGSATDLGIVYTGNGGTDLIAIVQDSTNVSLSRDFQFV